MKYIYTFFCLFLLSGVAYAEEHITGAFGQKLGATIDENIHKFNFGYSMEDARQAPVYNFFPEKNIGPFEDYRVQATPATKRIYKIGAVGRFTHPAQCLPERIVLQMVLETKYPSLKSWTSKDSYTWEVYTKTPHRFISVECKYKDEAGNKGHQLNASEATISIRYVDSALADVVLKERASMLDDSNF